MVSISKEAQNFFRAFGPMHFYRPLRAAAALQREIKLWCWCSFALYRCGSGPFDSDHLRVKSALFPKGKISYTLHHHEQFYHKCIIKGHYSLRVVH